MTEYNASMTVFEAFYRNDELLYDETADQAWRNILYAIQDANPHVERMKLCNINTYINEPVLYADFVTELSETMFTSICLIYDVDEQTLSCSAQLDETTLINAEENDNLREPLAERNGKEFTGDKKLSEISDGILTYSAQMAYEALHRANSKLFPFIADKKALIKIIDNI
ncbi:Uncharacterised protein [Pseudomonas fluorescens]|uniref:Uncharacterized protein n=1 Tax=Pseudomonas fluorescens TaxID=294 RepID=A0A379IG55_PSEFL|nr:hypothetical protein [Pseudomonas fluorescens]SUD31805.1 Uncharacterised protein [Pseudomonas fluorescens]